MPITDKRRNSKSMNSREHLIIFRLSMHFLIGITAMFQMADGQSEQEIMYGSQFVLDPPKPAPEVPFSRGGSP